MGGEECKLVGSYFVSFYSDVFACLNIIAVDFLKEKICSPEKLNIALYRRRRPSELHVCMYNGLVLALLFCFVFI